MKGTGQDYGNMQSGFLSEWVKSLINTSNGMAGKPDENV